MGSIPTVGFCVRKMWFCSESWPLDSWMIACDGHLRWMGFDATTRHYHSLADHYACTALLSCTFFFLFTLELTFSMGLVASIRVADSGTGSPDTALGGLLLGLFWVGVQSTLGVVAYLYFFDLNQMVLRTYRHGMLSRQTPDSGHTNVFTSCKLRLSSCRQFALAFNPHSITPIPPREIRALLLCIEKLLGGT